MDLVRRQWVWLAWLVMALATLCAHLPSVRLSPTVWQDEVQIVDYGRVLTPGADLSYAATWSADDRPAVPLFHLGNLLQNTSYRLAGGDLAGVRIASIIGAMAASLALLGWLLARGTLPWIALGCSTLLLWDPVFAQGYRGGRVDGWAVACVLGACWLAQTAAWRNDDAGRGWRCVCLPAAWMFPAGVLVGVAGHVWVSAILVVPLLIFTMAPLKGCLAAEWPAWLARVAWVGGVALACFLLLLVPYAGWVGWMVHDLVTLTQSHVSSGGLKVARLLETFRISPWLPLAGVAALFLPRNRGLALVFIATVLGVFATGVYIHRAVYLLPCLLAAVAVASEALWSAAGGNRWLKPALAAAFGGALLWSGGVSLGARTFVALRDGEGRNPDHLVTLLRAHLPEAGMDSALRVFLGSWELYYAVRELGCSFHRRTSTWSDPQFRQFIATMDLLAYKAGEPGIPAEEMMRDMGFEFVRATAVTRSEGSPPPAYGEYVLFRKIRPAG